MSDHTYYETTFKSCRVKCKGVSNVPEDTVFPVHPGLEQLMRALKDKRPKWEFVYDTNWVSIGREVQSVDVYEGSQKLGGIGAERWDTKRSPYRFTYDNERLTAKRSRGYSSKSVDLRKAVREITKAFFPKTKHEIIAETKKDSYNIASSVTARARQGFNYAFDRVLVGMRTDIMANWERIRELAPTTHGQADELPDLHEKYVAAMEISEAMEKPDKHDFIVVMDDKYMSINEEDAQGYPIEYTNDTLPTHMRTALGLLKLVNKGDMIPGYGVRTSETAFLITKGAKA